jgi:hypothetical protein
MKFWRAILCLLVSVIPLCLADIIYCGVSESWSEVLLSLIVNFGVGGGYLAFGVLATAFLHPAL